MVDIIYKNGNLLDAEERIIMHGCNAQGIMGAGVAKQIKEKFPESYLKYREAFNKNRLYLGNIIWSISGEKIIGNAITQENYGGIRVKPYIDYEALTEVIYCINDMIEVFDFYNFGDTSTILNLELIPVAFPLIGAGFAGGSWKNISRIIQEKSKYFQPIIYTLDGEIPND